MNRGCVLGHTKACDYGPWPLQHHHVLPKQRIKRHFGMEIRAYKGPVADERNLVPLCERHHHRITHGHDRPLLAPVLSDRKDELADFAREIGMLAGLERELRLYGVVFDFDGVHGA